MRNLNEIAREVLVEEGRVSLHKLQHVLQIGSRAMNELNIDVTGVLKTVELTPNSYGAIDAPNDMQDWSKLAVCINGELYTLSVNDAMCFPSDLNSCGELLPEKFNENSFQMYLQNALVGGFGMWLYGYSSINEYGEMNAKLFGYGSGYNSIGCFRYNPERRQFFFSTPLQSKKITLEYFSNGLNQGLILVPDEATETVISFILWKKSRGNERAQFKQEYFTNLLTLQQRSFNFSIHDFIAATRKSYHQAAKA